MYLYCTVQIENSGFVTLWFVQIIYLLKWLKVTYYALLTTHFCYITKQLTNICCMVFQELNIWKISWVSLGIWKTIYFWNHWEKSKSCQENYTIKIVDFFIDSKVFHMHRRSHEFFQILKGSFVHPGIWTSKNPIVNPPAGLGKIFPHQVNIYSIFYSRK